MTYGKILLGALVTLGALQTQAEAQQQFQRPQATMPQVGAPHPGEHAEHSGKKGHSEHSGKEHSGHSEHSGKKGSGKEGLSPVKKELVALLEENKSSSIHCALKDGKPHTIRSAPMIVSVKKEETKVEKDKGDFVIDYSVGGKKTHLICPRAALSAE